MNLFSTIYLNFITFPFKKAVRFPILIFGKISIKNARKGKMVFNCPLKTGTLQIGSLVWDFLIKRTVLRNGIYQVHYMCMVELQLVRGAA